MRQDNPIHLTPRMEQAIHELKDMITAHFPQATFVVVAALGRLDERLCARGRREPALGDQHRAAPRVRCRGILQRTGEQLEERRRDQRQDDERGEHLDQREPACRATTCAARRCAIDAASPRQAPDCMLRGAALH